MKRIMTSILTMAAIASASMASDWASEIKGKMSAPAPQTMGERVNALEQKLDYFIAGVEKQQAILKNLEQIRADLATLVDIEKKRYTQDEFAKMQKMDKLVRDIEQSRQQDIPNKMPLPSKIEFGDIDRWNDEMNKQVIEAKRLSLTPPPRQLAAKEYEPPRQNIEVADNRKPAEQLPKDEYEIAEQRPVVIGGHKSVNEKLREMRAERRAQRSQAKQEPDLIAKEKVLQLHKCLSLDTNVDKITTALSAKQLDPIVPLLNSVIDTDLTNDMAISRLQRTLSTAMKNDDSGGISAVFSICENDGGDKIAASSRAEAPAQKLETANVGQLAKIYRDCLEDRARMKQIKSSVSADDLAAHKDFLNEIFNADFLIRAQLLD